jgi:hypothetical protein
MSQMKRSLVEAKFKKAGTLRNFIEQELAGTKGVRKHVYDEVAQLLLVSEKVRKAVAVLYTDQIHNEMHEAALRQAAVRDRAANIAKLTKQIDAEEKNIRDTQTERVKNHKKLAEVLDAADDAKLNSVIHSRDSEAEFAKFVHSILPSENLTVWTLEDWRTAFRGMCSIKSRRDKDRRWFEEVARVAATEEKARSFERIILTLDAMTVGSKLLGDCTGGDLLREAARLEAGAGHLTAQAVFYRELAAIVGKTTTVREANDRGKVLALLSTTYKEEV